METTIVNYEQQALDFLTRTKTTMTVEFVKNGKHFEGDKHNRDIYKVTFKRGTRQFSVDFGQSLTDSAKIVDTATGNEFTTDGKGLRGGMRVTDMRKYRIGLGRQLKDVKGVPPTAYDVLSTLEKYGFEDFTDFCDTIGCDTDSRAAERVYRACVKQYDGICRLWSDDEIEQLIEIQ